MERKKLMAFFKNNISDEEISLPDDPEIKLGDNSEKIQRPKTNKIMGSVFEAEK